MNVLLTLVLLLSWLSVVLAQPCYPPGLVRGLDATVLKDGKPYRGIGVNYFDCFLRTLKKDGETSYDAGFATLAAKGIPFARFCATGFWPSDMKLSALYSRLLPSESNRETPPTKS